MWSEVWDKRIWTEDAKMTFNKISRSVKEGWTPGLGVGEADERTAVIEQALLYVLRQDRLTIYFQFDLVPDSSSVFKMQCYWHHANEKPVQPEQHFLYEICSLAI